MPIELFGRSITELLNDTYFIENISLFDEHIAYVITRPSSMSSMNYAKFFPATQEYRYSANGCDWIIVGAGNQVELEGFEISSLIISNEAIGAGVLRIYLEGVGV